MGLGSGLGPNARLTVAPWGDSITAGYGSTPGDVNKNCGYRYPLWQLGQAAGIKMLMVGNQTLPGPDAGVLQKYHGAVSGLSIVGMTNRILAQPGLFPEIACLMAGANDTFVLSPAATMAAQLDTSILTAWNVGQRPGNNRTKLVIVAQIPDVFIGVNVAAIHQLVIDYNALIPALVAAHVAAGRNVKMIDLYTPLGANPGPNFNAGSQPHPNTAGYSLMAPIWFGTPGSGSGLICDYTR